jgi:glyoxylase-like metal-dependent hydrolase (beta-lactamase superfamily II)
MLVSRKERVLDGMSRPIVVDTMMLDERGITAAFVVRGSERTALVETGPKSTVANVERALAEAGVDDLDAIVVTHVHLDHAGAAGTLARRFPRARVLVHEIGAPHLADPTKLWSSASRIYGDAMESMWGGIDPVPDERLVAVADGDEVDLGGGVVLRAVATPGHASHHHALLDEGSGAVYAGDALGVRLPDLGVLRPATPPPEFDLEQAVASIERIRELAPAALFLTHYGSVGSGADGMPVDAACDEAIALLRRWAEWVTDARAESENLDEAAARVRLSARSSVESRLDADQVVRLEKTTSYRMNTWGYMRYLERREGAALSR